MHPLRVAASTGLGALASVLALLFPVPRLAYCEVRKACQQYVENALERLNLFVEAFAALSHSAALDLLSQAKSFSNTAAKLLQSIKLKQEGIVWERPEIRFLKPNYMNPREDCKTLKYS
ncbi:hypothetical protein L1049_008058 [Liquidambar formosana]|uniref:Uncharacterized protein n=1 Tax=Liquidambar formosana TaxID=63359 RepID=A0AAP0X567_LIQFO